MFERFLIFFHHGKLLNTQKLVFKALLQFCYFSGKYVMADRLHIVTVCEMTDMTK